MFKNIFTLLVAVFFISQGCQKSDGFETTESGLQYRFVKKADSAVQPQDGEILTLDLIMINATDSVLMDVQDLPIQKNLEVWSEMAGGIEEAFSLLSKGDSLIAKVNAGDLYQRTWRMPLPPNMKPEDLITCHMKLQDVMDENAYRKKEAMTRIDQIEAFREQVLTQSQPQMELDEAAIDAYLKKNNISANTTETGLRYVILKEGTGPVAQVGDQVKVNYTGKVLEGGYFDSSVEEKAKEVGLYNASRSYEPYEFILGTGGVIHGWDEGIALLNKGAKARLFIPSPMGYGTQQRSEVIIANSILDFDVELVDIVASN